MANAIAAYAARRMETGQDESSFFLDLDFVGFRTRYFACLLCWICFCRARRDTMRGIFWTLFMMCNLFMW